MAIGKEVPCRSSCGLPSTTIRAVARALGGDVVGAQVVCPGPGHRPIDRSLSVRLSQTAPDGFVVFSHAGDDIGACRDHVRALMNWDRGRWRSSSSIGRVPQQVDVGVEKAANIARANAIWTEARDPRGTIVEHYLASRGLILPNDMAGNVIRFHPACPWADPAEKRTLRVPAMISAMVSCHTKEITGVHRTRLTTGGMKVSRRMLGKAGGAAVMLGPIVCEARLAIGEGIETCLAAWQMGWTAVWAVGSVAAIDRFPVLPEVRSLVLLAETGDDGASACAIENVAGRYYAAGRDVLIVEPRCIGDMNDVLQAVR